MTFPILNGWTRCGRDGCGKAFAYDVKWYGRQWLFGWTPEYRPRVDDEGEVFYVEPERIDWDYHSLWCDECLSNLRRWPHCYGMPAEEYIKEVCAHMRERARRVIEFQETWGKLLGNLER